jgi:hypothetical protein
MLVRVGIYKSTNNVSSRDTILSSQYRQTPATQQGTQYTTANNTTAPKGN